MRPRCNLLVNDPKLTRPALHFCWQCAEHLIVSRVCANPVWLCFRCPEYEVDSDTLRCGCCIDSGKNSRKCACPYHVIEKLFTYHDDRDTEYMPWVNARSVVRAFRRTMTPRAVSAVYADGVATTAFAAMKGRGADVNKELVKEYTLAIEAMGRLKGLTRRLNEGA